MEAAPKARPINDYTSIQYLKGRSPGTGRNDPQENGGAGRTPSEARGGWTEGTANQRFHKYTILERAKPGNGAE